MEGKGRDRLNIKEFSRMKTEKDERRAECEEKRRINRNAEYSLIERYFKERGFRRGRQEKIYNCGSVELSGALCT